jgi:hypothetical protein
MIYECSGGWISALGLVGGLVAAAANSGQKNQKRQEEMNNSTLDELINDHKHDYRVRLKEIEAARFRGRRPRLNRAALV